MVNDRERKLLIEAYMIGIQNAALFAADGVVIKDLRAEAVRWVDEPIADNGGTVGDYIGWEIEDT